jgi:hypothetical protein
MGPSIFFSSSDVTATTCFGHTTIVMRYIVVYCKLQSSKKLKTVYYCMPHDDGRMTETCFGEEVVALTGHNRLIIHTQQEAPR